VLRKLCTADEVSTGFVGDEDRLTDRRLGRSPAAVCGRSAVGRVDRAEMLAVGSGEGGTLMEGISELELSIDVGMMPHEAFTMGGVEASAGLTWTPSAPTTASDASTGDCRAGGDGLESCTTSSFDSISILLSISGLIVTKVSSAGLESPLEVADLDRLLVFGVSTTFLPLSASIPPPDPSMAFETDSSFCRFILVEVLVFTGPLSATLDVTEAVEIDPVRPRLRLIPLGVGEEEDAVAFTGMIGLAGMTTSKIRFWMGDSVVVAFSSLTTGFSSLTGAVLRLLALRPTPLMTLVDNTVLALVTRPVSFSFSLLTSSAASLFDLVDLPIFSSSRPTPVSSLPTPLRC
jgi:hypothetical protein